MVLMRRSPPVVYRVTAKKDYRELDPARIRAIRTARGETQTQFAAALTEIIARWSGIGTVPVAQQSVQQYEAGLYRVNGLVGPAILVLEEEHEQSGR